jgi:GTP1/Obg family GTP-binding protein
MNKYGQIFTQVFTPTTANACIEHMLQRLQKRQELVGCSVDCIYVDNCCKIRAFLMGIFGSSTVILLDVYHLIIRILRTLSKLCPYYTNFARDLSDCIFQVNRVDVLAAKKKSF